MRVFISWSGDTSKRLAYVLNEWMPQVINAIEPFLSSEDIAKGTRGLDVIAEELEASDCGIICVTEQNFSAPWINFEAGALSKQVSRSRVIPILLNLSFTQMRGPLTQFQHVVTNENDLRQLMRDLNTFADAPLTEGQLDRALDKWMPDLIEDLELIKASANQPAAPERSVSDLLGEVLQVVRGVEAEMTRQRPPRGKKGAVELAGPTPRSGPRDEALAAVRRRLSKSPGTFTTRYRASHGDICITVKSGSLSKEVQTAVEAIAADHGIEVRVFEARDTSAPNRGPYVEERSSPL